MPRSALGGDGKGSMDTSDRNVTVKPVSILEINILTVASILV